MTQGDRFIPNLFYFTHQGTLHISLFTMDGQEVGTEGAPVTEPDELLPQSPGKNVTLTMTAKSPRNSKLNANS